MKHPIISMVKSVCKSYGVRFIVARSAQSTAGLFDATDKTLTVWRRYRRGKGKRRGKPRIRKMGKVEMLATVVHEMVHILQWKRRDPNWDVRDDSGKRIDQLVYDALVGESWADTERLERSALAAARLEFEADLVALRTLDLFGVEYLRSTLMRANKAYAYSYLVFVKTGIMADRKMYPKWYKYITNKPEFDLTHGDLSKLCDIARANSDLSFVVWRDNVCIKSLW